MKRLYEKDWVGLQCRLRLMFRSHGAVEVTFGEGNENQELFARTENGIPTLTSSIPKPFIIMCPAESQFLESSSVRKATENLFLSEEDSKLVNFTESYISKKTGKPGQQIKDVTLTISFNNGSDIHIYHGNKSQKIKCMTADGKPTLIWEYRIEPDDVMDKLNVLYQDTPIENEKDKTLYKYLLGRLHKEKFKLKGGRLRIVLESTEHLTIVFGEGEQELLACFSNGSPELTSAFQTVEYTFSEQSQFLESASVRKATENLFLSEEDSKLVNFTESYISRKTGKPGQQIKDVTLTISFNNGRDIHIYHGNKSQKIKCMTADGKPTLIWEYRIEPDDVMDKLNVLYQDTPIENEKDKTLYKYLLGRLHKEKFKLKGGRLRIVLESTEHLTIVFGEGEQELLACFSNGIPELTSAFQTVEYTFPEQSHFLESASVRKATENLFLSEEDSKLVNFTESYISKKTGKPGQQIKDVTLTISFNNGSDIHIYHGNKSQKIKCMTADGKPTLIWEYRIEPDDVLDKLNVLYQDTPIENENDKTLYKYLLGRLHKEKFKLKGGRLRIVLESTEHLTIVFGEGEQELLACFSNGSPELTSAFQTVEYTFPEQSQYLKSPGVEKAIAEVFLNTAETRIVDYAKETIAEINGKPFLKIENTTVTISLRNGSSINIRHGRHESQQLNFYTMTDGTPSYKWESRDIKKGVWEYLYKKITDFSNLKINSWLLNILAFLGNYLFRRNDKKTDNGTKPNPSPNENKTGLKAPSPNETNENKAGLKAPSPNETNENKTGLKAPSQNENKTDLKALPV